MAKILNLDPEIDIKQCLLWQYANSHSLRKLIDEKEAWYRTNAADFFTDWYNNVFNIETATDFGLQIWGEILNFPRQGKSKFGNIYYLTTEQYRAILKGQMLKFNMGGTATDVNRWLKVVFGNKTYCLDNENMTAVPFVFEGQEPTPELLWLLSNVDFLPRPAGVGYKVEIVPESTFGFYGSNLQPFNQGVFYHDYNIDIGEAENKFQLKINCKDPNATITINAIETNYQVFTINDSYTWSVSRPGFKTLSGSGVITEDVIINVATFEIIKTPQEAATTINGQNLTGVYFRKGTIYPYSYVVSNTGYTTKTGTGETETDLTIVVDLQVETQYNYSLTEFQTDSVPVSSISTYTAQVPGFYSIQIKGAASSNGQGKGGVLQTKLDLNVGDDLEFKKISGRMKDGFYSGCGVALYKNNELLAVAGGGSYSYHPSSYFYSLGGGGYVGGGTSIVGTIKSFNRPGVPAGTGYPGYSITGTTGNYTARKEGACGAYTISEQYNRSAAGFGGSSYVGNSIAADTLLFSGEDPEANAEAGSIEIKYLGI